MSCTGTLEIKSTFPSSIVNRGPTTVSRAHAGSTWDLSNIVLMIRVIELGRRNDDILTHAEKIFSRARTAAFARVSSGLRRCAARAVSTSAAQTTSTCSGDPNAKLAIVAHTFTPMVGSHS